jgi:hypothetical protein
MKKMQEPKTDAVSEDLNAEYHFDYKKAKPNRFAGRVQENRVVVVLDPDVAQVFKTPEAVNDVLRALINTMPLVDSKK